MQDFENFQKVPNVSIIPSNHPISSYKTNPRLPSHARFHLTKTSCKVPSGISRFNYEYFANNMQLYKIRRTLRKIQISQLELEWVYR